MTIERKHIVVLREDDLRDRARIGHDVRPDAARQRRDEHWTRLLGCGVRALLHAFVDRRERDLLRGSLDILDAHPFATNDAKPHVARRPESKPIRDLLADADEALTAGRLDLVGLDRDDLDRQVGEIESASPMLVPTFGGLLLRRCGRRSRRLAARRRRGGFTLARGRRSRTRGLAARRVHFIRDSS